jgi:hypothetical protein
MNPDDEYKKRIVPKDIKYTALDLPRMYMRCWRCDKINSNFTIHWAKPSRLCDDCYEKEFLNGT